MSTSSSQPSSISLLFLQQTRYLGVIWVSAALLGVAVISATSMATPHRLVWPILILFLYAGYALNRWASEADVTPAHKQAIVAQIADSIYFMGFVWTLWALIDSFVFRSQVSVGTAMFRAFGYALVTTFVGMFLRLAVLQFKYTAADQSQAAQETLEDRLRKFGETVGETERALAHWRISLELGNEAMQQSNEALQQVLKQITAQTDESVKQWRTSLELGRQGIETSNKELQQVLKQVATQTDESVKQTIQALREGIKNAIFRLEAVTVKISEQVEASFRKGIENGLSDFKREMAMQLSEIHEGTSALSNAVRNGAADVAQSNVKIADSYQRIRSALEAATASIGAVGDQFSDAGAKVERAAGQFAQSLPTIREAVLMECKATGNAFLNVADEARRDFSVKLNESEGVIIRAVRPTTDLLGTIGASVKGIQDVVGVSREGDRASLISELRDRLPSRMENSIARVDSRLERIENQIGAAILKQSDNGRKWWKWGKRRN